MPLTPVILITGHPATGKSTLAEKLAVELRLPLVSKDIFKEALMNCLEGGGAEWSRQLSRASMRLLYLQVESLLRAGAAHIAEANFDPALATVEWRRLGERYPLRLIQVRCECQAEILLERYRQRIAAGNRHPGHVDDSHNPVFLEKIGCGPLDWVAVDSSRIAVDTSDPQKVNLAALLEAIHCQMQGEQTEAGSKTRKI